MLSFLRRYFELVLHRPKIVLLGVGFLFLLSLWQIPKLTLKSDMFDLLPEHFDSVRNIRTIEKQFGGFGVLMLAVDSTSFEEGKLFVEQLALRLSSLPEIRYVDYRQPIGFFYTRRFLFLSLGALHHVDTRVADSARRFEKASGEEEIEKIGNETLKEFQDLKKEYQFALPTEEQTYHYDPEAKRFVLLVKPTFRASHLDQGKKLLKDIEEVFEALPGKENFKMGYTGRYAKRIEMDTFMRKEMQKAAVLSFIGIAVLLFLLFQRMAAITAACVSLIVSMVWTFGFTAFSVGSVNVLTGFSAAVLSGLGIDYAIYLISRYQRERALGNSPQESLRTVFTHTSRTTWVACLTTLLAFASLIPSEFKGFSEFGWMGMWGLIFTFIAMHTILPFLLILWDHRVQKKLRVTLQTPDWFSRCVRLPGRIVIGFSLIGMVIGFVFFWPPHFEYNFSKLEGKKLPSYQLEESIEKMFSRSMVPALALVHSQEEELKLIEAIQKVKKEDENSSIQEVQSLNQFVPTEQKKKTLLLKNILKNLEKLPIELFEGVSEDVAGLILAQDFQKITIEDLPLDLKRKFEAGNGVEKLTAVQIYSNVDHDDIQDAKKFSGELREINRQAGGIQAVSELMILSDISDILQKDGPRVLLVLIFTLIVVLWWDVRSWRHALILIFPLLVGSGFILILMSLFGISLNLINVTILPILLGLGIDNVTHQYHAFKEFGKKNLAGSLWQVFPSISLAVLTSMIGFGMLAIVDHPGIASFGKLAILGMLVMYLVAWLLTPILLRTWFKER